MPLSPFVHPTGDVSVSLGSYTSSPLQAEHLLTAGVPVQLLPAYNALVEAALSTAQLHDYAGVPVRVVDAEHLVALALPAGGARRRERAWQLLEAGAVDRERLRKILTTHAIAAEVPDDA